jgi:hypothetical protein
MTGHNEPRLFRAIGENKIKPYYHLEMVSATKRVRTGRPIRFFVTAITARQELCAKNLRVDGGMVRPAFENGEHWMTHITAKSGIRELSTAELDEVAGGALDPVTVTILVLTGAFVAGVAVGKALKEDKPDSSTGTTPTPSPSPSPSPSPTPA